MLGINQSPHRRETSRKRAIREILATEFQGQPALLDELRWKVLRRQESEAADDAKRRSLLNSFARTVREQLPECETRKVPISPETPIGLVAKAAVFRMRDLGFLPRFLASQAACILCRYQTDRGFNEPRWRSRYVIPQHHAATFRFFERRPIEVRYIGLASLPGSFIPATHKLTFVVPIGATIDLATLGAVPWQLFGYDSLNDWYQVNGTDPLELVHRNRYF